MRAVELLKSIGRPNAYYPKLAKVLGGVNPAVLFSQLFYWQDKATSNLGVYKTRDELEEETGLTHNEQRTAIKKLQEKGVLIVTEKRLEHRTYYKIDNEKVNEILTNFANSIYQTQPTQDNTSPELDNVEIGEAKKSISLDQEITTKITTKTTNNRLSDDKPKTTNKSTFLSDDFRPNEKHQELAIANRINLNDEFEKFKDYCLANGKRYVDWNAGFNNWLRNSIKFSSNTVVKQIQAPSKVDYQDTSWADKVNEAF